MAAILNLRNSKWLQKWLICLYSFFRYTGLAFDWKPKNLEFLLKGKLPGFKLYLELAWSPCTLFYAAASLTQDFSTSDSYILDECTKNHSFARCRASTERKKGRNDTRNEILFPISRHVNACISLATVLLLRTEVAGLSKLLGIARWTVEEGTHLTSISTVSSSRPSLSN